MRIITINGKKKSINDLVEMVKMRLEMCNDGHPSQYITIRVTEDELTELFSIRVSDHTGRKQNNSLDTLSFISNRVDQGYDRMSNEYLVDDLEDMLTDECNHRGYLSVEEIIEDFINDLELN